MLWNITRAGLLGSATFLALTSAAAQTAPAAVPVVEPVAATSGQIEDIIVTATRRNERLQSVPISITALTASALVDAGITTTADLGQRTPGLVITNQNGALTPFLRGVGSGEASAGQEAAVATYVDGVYIAAPYGITLGLNNIDRIEVLKGPQGTLFGRNASGGLIHIITRDPKQETAIEASAGYGNYDTITGRLYATTGVTENVAADLAVYYNDQRNGFGINETTGNDTYKSRELALRSKLLFTPSDRTRIVVAGEYSDYKFSTGSTRQLLPGSYGLDGTTTYTGNFYNVTGNFDALLDGRTFGTSVHFSQEFDPFTLVSITAYRNTKQRLVFDNDQTPLAIFDADLNYQFYRTFTQELQLVSGPDSPFKWIVGAFYMNDHSGFDGPLGVGLFGSGVGGAVGIHGILRTESYAAFAEATFKLASQTNLTVGGRYTIDKRHVRGFTDILDPATQNVLLTFPSPTQHKTYREPTYRVILDQHLSDDTMLYASYSRGFKSGNFNTTNTGDPAVKPETNDAFEAGFKADLLGRTLRLNGAVFFYKYKNIQLPVLDRATIKTINAADSDIKGAELEGQINLSDHFSLAAGVAFLDSNIKRFPGATCFVANPAGVGGDSTVPCDVVGNRLPKSPKFTFNLAPSLTIPSKVGEFGVTASYQHTSRFFWDTSNNRRLSNRPLDLVNGQVRWTDTSEHYTVAVFGRNLLNKKYYNFVNPGNPGDTFSAASPLTYGAEVSVKF